MVKPSKKAASAARKAARTAATDAKKKLPVQSVLLNQFGFTIKRKPGRPKKLVSPPPAPPTKTPSPAAAAKTPSPAAVTDEKPAAKRQIHRWNSPESFDVLKRAILAEAGDEKELSPEFASIPRSTFKRLKERFRAAAKEHGISLEDVVSSMVFKEKGKPLLSKDEVVFFCSVLEYRDSKNRGATRAEAITLIMDIAQCGNRKRAENHYDYLVREKKLIDLKRDGRVTSAQGTTTKRTQINAEQQLRWMGTIEAARDELYRLNKPTALFKEVEAHFWGNLDETCLLASEGTIKVVASNKKTKTELVKDDCRASITVLRIGFAAGVQGPLIFLAKGKTMDRPSLKVLLRQPGVPPGSVVLMTPNAFMNDETWEKIVPLLAKAIRELPVIRDHKDWWVVVSLDGFGSHVNVGTALKVFHEHKIFIIKEEGDTSQVNQAYDQWVAKRDKSMMRDALNTVRGHLGCKMDQWYLIAVAVDALKKVGADPWIDSFKKVNMHPATRVSGEEWLKILDARGVLSAEKFFDKRTSLYDAMPAVWKKLQPEERHEVIAVIKQIYAKTSDEPVWTKANVVQLAKYAPVDEVYKLRACYHASLCDPSVICRVTEEHQDTAVVAEDAEEHRQLVQLEADRDRRSVQERQEEQASPRALLQPRLQHDGEPSLARRQAGRTVAPP